MTRPMDCSPYLGKPLRSEEEARYGVRPGKLGCDYCHGQPEPGWLATVAYGRVPCPICNKEAGNAPR